MIKLNQNSYKIFNNYLDGNKEKLLVKIELNDLEGSYNFQELNMSEFNFQSEKQEKTNYSPKKYNIGDLY